MIQASMTACEWPAQQPRCDLWVPGRAPPLSEERGARRTRQQSFSQSPTPTLRACLAWWVLAVLWERVRVLGLRPLAARSLPPSTPFFKRPPGSLQTILQLT